MVNLRSIFIAIYPIFLVVATAWSGTRLIEGTADALGWWGVLMTTAPFLLLLLRAFIVTDMARTSRRLPTIQGLAIVGLFLAFFAFSISGRAVALELLLAAAGLAAFTLYNFWYSELQAPDNQALEPGQPLPEFSLRTVDGEAVPSTELATGPSFILFYRGNWCPFCMAQIKELVASYAEIESRGVKVVLVSSQPQKKTAMLTGRFSVNFRFLMDPGGAAARALGICVKGGLPMGLGMMGYEADTVMPTIILVGSDGRIVKTVISDNYRVRPEPDTLIGMLEA